MAKISIAPKYHSTILDWLADGLSTRQIAAKLSTDFGVQAHSSTVHRLVRSLRKQRSETAKAVVREEIASTLTRDLRRLERLKCNLLRRFARSPSDDIAAKLAEQIRKLIETALKYSGAEDRDDTPATPLIMLPPESDD